MDDERVETRLSLRLGRYGSQTGVGLPLLQMLCSSLRMFQFRLGMDWLCLSTEQRCLSFAPARINRTPAFQLMPLLLLLLVLVLLLLLLLASAAGASVAAAAAALFVGPALCFIFDSNSSAKAIWWWMLYRTLRKVTCTNMRKTRALC